MSHSRFECALYPTILTPFTPDGSAIDYASLKKLIRIFADCGCDGIFAVCQSSEMFFLSDDEKIELAAFTIAECRRLGMGCVASGHTQDALADQIAYLKRLEALSPDAIILVSNRLAAEGEPDSAALESLAAIVGALRPETRLGVYECPYPYKRLLSPEVLDYMVDTGRFDFVKDTCCDPELLTRRIKRLEGTGVGLYNANAATLMQTTYEGAAGFSGVLLNFVPELFGLFKRRVSGCELPERLHRKRTGELFLPAAEAVAAHISAYSTIEYQNYPANAKYFLTLRGVFASDVCRNGKPPLTPSQRQEVRDFERMTREAYIGLIDRVYPALIFEEGRHFDSCHASCVLPLPDGAVLAAYFAGTREGADDVSIWLSRKEAGAEQWSSPVLLAKVCGDAHWNPVLFQTACGVRLVFKVGKKISHWQSWTMLSADGGHSWSQPQPYGTPFGPVRSKPIRLSSGALLAPDSDEDGVWSPAVDISANEGETFERLAAIPCPVPAIQPTLWEDAPGHVHALLRTQAGLVYRSDSTDGGASWCDAYPTALPNNNSGIDVTAAPDGTLYLACNPIGRCWGRRTPLVIYRSRDGGQSWQVFCTAADGRVDQDTHMDAEFSYPSLIWQEDALHLTYTHMRRQVAYCRIAL